MRQPASSGKSSIGEELEAIQRITGQKQPELSFPPIPGELSSLYSHYGKISEVSDLGLMAYSNLMQVKFSPEEVELLKDIEYINRAVSNGRKPHQILELFGYG